MTEAIIAYVLANILDVVSTKKVLKNGGVELNPILRYAMDKGGNKWIVLKFSLAGAALGIFFVCRSHLGSLGNGCCVCGCRSQ